MYWPVRMCHPVSPSPSRAIQPLTPHTNIQRIRAIKKQSESDGLKMRASTCPTAPLDVPVPAGAGVDSIDSAAPDCGGGCVEVAKDTARSGPQIPGHLIDLGAHFH